MFVDDLFNKKTLTENNGGGSPWHSEPEQQQMDADRRGGLERERNAGLDEPDDAPSDSAPTGNGVYEYTVPAGQEDIAQELGLQQHRGHWVSRVPIQRANFQFGRPQFHEIPAKGVAEGLGKTIKRGMAGWGAFDKDKPADVVKRVKDQDTDTLKGLSNRGSTGKGSPAELQQKAIGRELKKRGEQGVAEGMLDNPGAQDSPVASAIIRRILLQRTDLLSKYGPEKVGAAVDEVADFVGDVDEIGSSDVSGWIRHVEQMLGNMGEGVAEDMSRRGFLRGLGAAALGAAGVGAASQAQGKVRFDADGNEIRANWKNVQGAAPAQGPAATTGANTTAGSAASSPSAASRAAANDAADAAAKIRYTNPKFRQEYEPIENAYNQNKSRILSNTRYSPNPDLAKRQQAEFVKMLTALDLEFAEKTNALLKQYSRLKEQGVVEGADDKFSMADKVEQLVDQYRLYDKRGWSDLFAKLAGRKLEVAEIRREMEYASKFLQLLDSIRMRSDYRGQQDPRKDQELIDLSNQWINLFNKATDEFKTMSGQGVAEGTEQKWTVTVGTKTGGTSHTMTFTGTKEQAIKKAVARFGTSKNPVVKAIPAKQGVTEDAVNTKSIITESKTYKIWESAGQKLVEAQLTADQINQIFQQVEQGATAAGGNRTMIGQGKDAAGAVNRAWEDLKTKVQNSGPIKNVDALYDKAAEQLKQATGGDQGVMTYVQKYRDFAKKHPVAQSLIYSALIAAAGISGAGLGGAAALGLFKLVDKLLQGEKFSSAAYSGAKTGGMAYAAGQIGQAMKGQSQGVPATTGADATAGATQNTLAATRQAVEKEAMAAIRSRIANGDIAPGNFGAIRDLAYKMLDGSGMPQQAIETSVEKLVTQSMGNAVRESKNLSESQIYLVIGKIVDRQRKLDEGIMDTIKGAAGKAVDWAKTKGTNLTTKITADKLLQAWKKAGSPTDSLDVAKVIQNAGVPSASIKQVYNTMKIPFAGEPGAQPAMTRKIDVDSKPTAATPAAATTPATATAGPTATPPAASKSGIQTGATALIDPDTGRPYEKDKLAAMYGYKEPEAAADDAAKADETPPAPVAQTPAQIRAAKQKAAAATAQGQMAGAAPAPVAQTPAATAATPTTNPVGFNAGNVMKLPGMEKYAKPAAPAKTANFAGPSGYGKITTSIKPPAAPSSPALAVPKAPAAPRITSGGPTPAEKANLDKRIAAAAAAPAVAETLAQVERMLESVNSKKSAEMVRAYVDQRFTELGLRNTTECRNLMARVVQESAIRRRQHAKSLAN